MTEMRERHESRRFWDRRRFWVLLSLLGAVLYTVLGDLAFLIIATGAVTNAVIEGHRE